MNQEDNYQCELMEKKCDSLKKQANEQIRVDSPLLVHERMSLSTQPKRSSRDRIINQNQDNEVNNGDNFCHLPLDTSAPSTVQNSIKSIISHKESINKSFVNSEFKTNNPGIPESIVSQNTAQRRLRKP